MTPLNAHSLIIGDVRAAYRQPALEGPVPGLSFTIKNNGGRTVKRIKVTCRFLDATGRAVAEETYQPVSEFDFANGKPLRGCLKNGQAAILESIRLVMDR